ncbi:MAG: tRNA 4-thiouridine(8) synthase ThiI [Clostridia bacterium]|nr:tRNA 4-thiouridine(8) synthase ThiI [Clostridia bacterium]
MADIILIKCGELILKGNNRAKFEDRLVKNIKSAVSKFGNFHVWKEQATMFVEGADETADLETVIEPIQKVFGIIKLSPAWRAEKNIDSIVQTAVTRCTELRDAKTFKVDAKRADKKFELKSPEICMEAGGHLLAAYPHLKVDLHRPDIVIHVDVRHDAAYVYSREYRGSGGIPTGTSGKGMLLLSGGIDSPVAGWMMAKRGMELEAIHFFSYPYTSERAKEKVIDLAKILTQYTGAIKLHIVPFTELQLAMVEKCPGDQITILIRRAMSRIAQKICTATGSLALITGESLGQVASQTLHSLVVTNEVAEIPVLRPLIGLDKEEIIQYARRIDTYETSILPYEDCCTIFVPKHPETKPKLEKIRLSESKLEMDALIQKAVDETEIIELN